MLDLQNFEIVNQKGFPKKGKFSSSYVVQEKTSSLKFILKTVRKSEKNQLAISALQNEVGFVFQEKGLPQLAILHENETEWVLQKNFVEGFELKEIFETIRKRNKIVFLKSFVNKTCELLSVLDDKGIVHADLRPENFLIEIKDNKDFNVHLIDFGLSFNRTSPPSRKVLFHLLYSSPELILNQIDLCNTKSDLYSLGLVLHRLLTKEAPFYHSNPSILTNLVLTYPLERSRKIPNDIWKTIERMCSKTYFKTAPNRLALTEMRRYLNQAIDKRTNLEELKQESSNWKEKYTWFNTNSNLFENQDSGKNTSDYH